MSSISPLTIRWEIIPFRFNYDVDNELGLPLYDEFAEGGDDE